MVKFFLFHSTGIGNPIEEFTMQKNAWFDFKYGCPVLRHDLIDFPQGVIQAIYQVPCNGGFTKVILKFSDDSEGVYGTANGLLMPSAPVLSVLNTNAILQNVEEGFKLGRDAVLKNKEDGRVVRLEHLHDIRYGMVYSALSPRGAILNTDGKFEGNDHEIGFGMIDTQNGVRLTKLGAETWGIIDAGFISYDWGFVEG